MSLQPLKAWGSVLLGLGLCLGLSQSAAAAEPSGASKETRHEHHEARGIRHEERDIRRLEREDQLLEAELAGLLARQNSSGGTPSASTSPLTTGQTGSGTPGVNAHPWEHRHRELRDLHELEHLQAEEHWLDHKLAKAEGKSGSSSNSAHPNAVHHWKERHARHHSEH